MRCREGDDRLSEVAPGMKLAPRDPDGPGMAQRPHPRRLGDVASWSIGQLSSDERHKLACLPLVLRLGTACSGSDCPAVVLRHLAAAIRQETGRCFDVNHVFSCEKDPKKQEFIRANFPELTAVFDDVTKLSDGVAHNVVSGSADQVPLCDIFVAGFVCKSVSAENPNRQEFGQCVSDATGITGETWQGVIKYIRVARPCIVICENVEGLTKGIRGCEPQIEPVIRDLRAAGYSASWRLLDSRHFHLPHRRNRCWIWGLLRASPQLAETAVPNTLQSLMHPHPVPLDDLFNGEQYEDGRELNDRELEVVAAATAKRRKTKSGSESQDWVIDVSKSSFRASSCLDACPCLVPNSRPYRQTVRKVLGPLQVLGLQGIWQVDFPQLAQAAHDSPRLLRDIAGNAFTSTVALSVCLAALVHGQYEEASGSRGPL